MGFSGCDVDVVGMPAFVARGAIAADILYLPVEYNCLALIPTEMISNFKMVELNNVRLPVSRYRQPPHNVNAGRCPAAWQDDSDVESSTK